MSDEDSMDASRAATTQSEIIMDDLDTDDSASPMVRYNPDALSFWAEHTGVDLLCGEHLEQVYDSLKPFFKDRETELADTHGWSAQSHDEDVLLLVSSSHHHAEKDVNLFLPTSFAPLLDPYETSTWVDLFEDPFIFEARREVGGTLDLYIDAPLPMVDIFYALQCIAPGLLQIVSIIDVGGGTRQQINRLLPPLSWIKGNENVLSKAMGTERMTSLIAAAVDTDKGYDMQWMSGDSVSADDYDSDSEFYYDNSASDHWTEEDDRVNRWGFRETPDFTACDKECGYCGQCPY